MTRVCSICKTEKDLIAWFDKAKEGKYGRRSQCKPCLKLYANQRRAKLAPEAKEKLRQACRDYHANNRAKIKERRRVQGLRATHNLSSEDYERMAAQQSNACAICLMHRAEQKRPLAVDHCHTTGEIRGLLCDKCNTGLGLFKDSPLLLEKAIQYLYRGR